MAKTDERKRGIERVQLYRSNRTETFFFCTGLQQQNTTTRVSEVISYRFDTEAKNYRWLRTWDWIRFWYTLGWVQHLVGLDCLTHHVCIFSRPVVTRTPPRPVA